MVHQGAGEVKAAAVTFPDWDDSYLAFRSLLDRTGAAASGLAAVKRLGAEKRGLVTDEEFRRLADSYKNEIWPGVYQEIDAANARFAAVTRARDALVASLTARPGRPA